MFSNNGLRKTIVNISLSFIITLSFSIQTVSAQAGEEETDDKKNAINRKVEQIFSGFTIGEHIRIFPYLSLADWFDLYAGLKLSHPSFLNSVDRMYHHIRFENIRDYSWKFRYLANSISSEKTKISFIFKRKTDRDLFFYGIGNSTSKSQRIAVKYASIFFGGEIKRYISPALVLRWSPAFWKFTSGLDEGGEFEQASNVRYISSRLTLSDIHSLEFWRIFLKNQWSAFVEIAFPVKTNATTYIRFHLRTRTQFPLYKSLEFSIGSRFENIIADDRAFLPYYALPETGSKNGLRGFSKERFRNHTIAVANFELSMPVLKYLEVFLLADVAKTASSPARLPGEKLHANFGFGFRLHNIHNPITVGFASGPENNKLFSSVAPGSTF